jgi:hypothetical protein
VRLAQVTTRSLPFAFRFRRTCNTLNGVWERFETRCCNRFTACYTGSIRAAVQPVERNLDPFDFPMTFCIKTV